MNFDFKRLKSTLWTMALMLMSLNVTDVAAQLTQKTPRAIRKEKRAEFVEACKEKNRVRMSIDAQERKERIADWMVMNPGKTEKDYWDWQEKRQKDKYVPIENLDRIKGKGAEKIKTVRFRYGLGNY